ncbi:MULTISPECIES: rod shape-determining protein MreD [unclassified Acinetobacter]|uniref:rod shape-determining protein MreD n=1 Tax=unclassified Acinetobacter TaxID=196816 RepID=UPI0029350B67|nr:MULTISPECIES: rod shape-determining protein MreD [unclassified Acinetobacter]WOE32801.1 rod shape-determining protein MreD [Acinetobacter sp. SAAs470]WOE38278.1 rod shape-determining protein MreD [Acinetobacter sp. SAAs474]
MLIAKLGNRLGATPNRDPLFPIIISVVIASVLTVYPLSYAISGWRPCFMFMVVLFWIMGQPTWCGVWFAFTTGLFTDLLIDAPLGMNALSFVVITFIARYLTRERYIMTFNNLWVITILALIAYLMLTFLMQVMGGIAFVYTRHGQPLLSSILVWPVMYYLLKKWRI